MLHRVIEATFLNPYTHLFRSGREVLWNDVVILFVALVVVKVLYYFVEVICKKSELSVSSFIYVAHCKKSVIMTLCC